MRLKLKLLSHYIFSAHAEPGIGWFRVFGVGLAWKDTKRHRLYFSERNGYTKMVSFKNWRITYLPKVGLPKVDDKWIK